MMNAGAKAFVPSGSSGNSPVQDPPRPFAANSQATPESSSPSPKSTDGMQQQQLPPPPPPPAQQPQSQQSQHFVYPEQQQFFQQQQKLYQQQQKMFAAAAAAAATGSPQENPQANNSASATPDRRASGGSQSGSAAPRPTLVNHFDPSGHQLGVLPHQGDIHAAQPSRTDTRSVALDGTGNAGSKAAEAIRTQIGEIEKVWVEKIRSRNGEWREQEAGRKLSTSSPHKDEGLSGSNGEASKSSAGGEGEKGGAVQNPLGTMEIVRRMQEALEVEDTMFGAFRSLLAQQQLTVAAKNPGTPPFWALFGGASAQKAIQVCVEVLGKAVAVRDEENRDLLPEDVGITLEGPKHNRGDVTEFLRRACFTHMVPLLIPEAPETADARGVMHSNAQDASIARVLLQHLLTGVRRVWAAPESPHGSAVKGSGGANSRPSSLPNNDESIPGRQTPRDSRTTPVSGLGGIALDSSKLEEDLRNAIDHMLQITWLFARMSYAVPTTSDAEGNPTFSSERLADLKRYVDDAPEAGSLLRLALPLMLLSFVGRSVIRQRIVREYSGVRSELTADQRKQKLAMNVKADFAAAFPRMIFSYLSMPQRIPPAVVHPATGLVVCSGNPFSSDSMVMVSIMGDVCLSFPAYTTSLFEAQSRAMNRRMALASVDAVTAGKAQPKPVADTPPLWAGASFAPELTCHRLSFVAGGHGGTSLQPSTSSASLGSSERPPHTHSSGSLDDLAVPPQRSTASQAAAIASAHPMSTLPNARSRGLARGQDLSLEQWMKASASVTNLGTSANRTSFSYGSLTQQQQGTGQSTSQPVVQATLLNPAGTTLLQPPGSASQSQQAVSHGSIPTSASFTGFAGNQSLQSTNAAIGGSMGPNDRTSTPPFPQLTPQQQQQLAMQQQQQQQPQMGTFTSAATGSIQQIVVLPSGQQASLVGTPQQVAYATQVQTPTPLQHQHQQQQQQQQAMQQPRVTPVQQQQQQQQAAQRGGAQRTLFERTLADMRAASRSSPGGDLVHSLIIADNQGQKHNMNARPQQVRNPQEALLADCTPLTQEWLAQSLRTGPANRAAPRSSAPPQLHTITGALSRYPEGLDIPKNQPTEYPLPQTQPALLGGPYVAEVRSLIQKFHDNPAAWGSHLAACLRQQLLMISNFAASGTTSASADDSAYRALRVLDALTHVFFVLKPAVSLYSSPETAEATHVARAARQQAFLESCVLFPSSISGVASQGGGFAAPHATALREVTEAAYYLLSAVMSNAISAATATGGVAAPDPVVRSHMLVALEDALRFATLERINKMAASQPGGVAVAGGAVHPLVAAPAGNSSLLQAVTAVTGASVSADVAQVPNRPQGDAGYDAWASIGRGDANNAASRGVGASGNGSPVAGDAASSSLWSASGHPPAANDDADDLDPASLLKELRARGAAGSPEGTPGHQKNVHGIVAGSAPLGALSFGSVGSGGSLGQQPMGGTREPPSLLHNPSGAAGVPANLLNMPPPGGAWGVANASAGSLPETAPASNNPKPSGSLW